MSIGHLSYVSRKLQETHHYLGGVIAAVQKASPEQLGQLFRKENPKGLACINSPTDPASSCGTAKVLLSGKLIHDHVLQGEGERKTSSQSVQKHMHSVAVEDVLTWSANFNQPSVQMWNHFIREHARQGKQDKAFQYFEQMQQEGVMPNRITFVFLLSANGSLAGSKQIHARIMGDDGLASDVVVGTAVVTMYGKCGSLKDAERMFDTMPGRNLVSWTAMIALCAQHEKCDKSLELFNRSLQEGNIGDKAAFICILAACASLRALAEGKRMHAYILVAGMESDVAVGTALVHMYCKCGSVDVAHRVFNKIFAKNVISWSAIMAGYSGKGQGKVALQLFHQMKLEGVLPNNITFINLLAACTMRDDLAYGRQIHTCIVDNGFKPDILVGNALINMYGKCGSLKEAWRILGEMPERDVISWNSMIANYTKHGQGIQAVQLLDSMHQDGVMPDKVTFIGIFVACASQEALVEGLRMHSAFMSSGLEPDVSLKSALIMMYGKSGSLKDAQSIFDSMHERNVVSWTGMVAVYNQCGQGDEALQYFDRMQQEGIIPNRVTFVNILISCADEERLFRGCCIHACILYVGIELDITINNALVSMYCSCGSLKNARTVFDKMGKHDAISWNAIISVYAYHRQHYDTFQLLHRMQLEGLRPNEVTFLSLLASCTSHAAVTEGYQIHSHILDWSFEQHVLVCNALVTMYGNRGKLVDARRTFDKMPERNVCSWNAMISVYVEHGEGAEALQLFDQMQQEGCPPDKITLLSMVSACAGEAALAQGKEMHSDIVEKGIQQDITVETALVRMYGKCGNLDDAFRVFHKMRVRNAVTWSAIIAVSAEHGQGKDVLQLFNQMQQEGVMPDEVTFISIFVGCSHAGLIDEGCCFITSMKLDHGILATMDHYVCLVDLFGRAGRLDEAKHLLTNMPCKPPVVSFMALLAACRYMVDQEKGECAVKHVFELDPEETLPQVLLSRIDYAAQWQEQRHKLYPEYFKWPPE